MENNFNDIPKKKVGRKPGIANPNARNRREIKKRVNFVLHPSLYEDFMKISEIQGLSMSAILDDLISEYVEHNQWIIDREKQNK